MDAENLIRVADLGVPAYSFIRNNVGDRDRALQFWLVMPASSAFPIDG